MHSYRFHARDLAVISCFTPPVPLFEITRQLTGSGGQRIARAPDRQLRSAHDRRREGA
jgi:hypothetical protein